MAGHLLKRHNCITGSPMLSQIRGTDEEHGGGIHRLPLASARPEPGPTPRGRIRHRRQQQVASTVADRGRRGHRQDQDARSSGRASDFEWRRPAPSAAADLHSARRARDDPARPPYPGRSSRQRRRLRVRQTAILPWSGTFHSVGSRLLRLHALSIGLDSSFTILDRSDSADLLELVRTEHGLSRSLSRFPRKDTCLAIYSYTVNAGCPLEETLAQTFPWCADWPNELRRLFEAYVVAKQRESVLDYDDLLLYWRHAMAETIVATEIRGCFDHILVDEYQDTNRLQAEILLALRPGDRATATPVPSAAEQLLAPRRDGGADRQHARRRARDEMALEVEGVVLKA